MTLPSEDALDLFSFITTCQQNQILTRGTELDHRISISSHIKKAIHSPSVLILTCCRTVSDFRQWKLSTQRPLNAMPTEKNGLSIDLAFQISDIQSSQRFGSKRKKKKPGFLCSPQSLKRRIIVLGHWYQRLVHKFELSGVKADFDQHQGQRDY